MFKKKVKTPTEKEIAFQEMAEAKAEIKRVRDLFGYADDNYFEIANGELTLAKMRYNLAVKKFRMLTDENENPQFDLFYNIVPF